MGKLTITAPRTDTDLRVGRAIWSWLRSKRFPAELTYDGSHVRLSMPFVDREELQLGLDCTTAWNVETMLAKPIPPLYETGVVYKREPMCRTNGVEHVCEEWLTAHEVVARGWGDCDDLGPFLAAQLRIRGDNRAQAFPKRSAAGWHILVRRGDGTIEDPSAILGMPTA